jgi:hypothetical protein
MTRTAGSMQMGSQPVAGRARAIAVCASGRSTMAAAHQGWHLGSRKPIADAFTAVPDTTTRARRPRGLT